MKIITAITGASGSIYARKFIELIYEHRHNIEECVVIFSDNGQKVWQYELSSDPLEFIRSYQTHIFRIARNNDLFDRVSSGSNLYEVMVVIPCSMGTLGRIAHGISDTLITRAADVMLKEKRQLILVPREAPFSIIHLQNMLQLAQAGATIFPAAPFFYTKPNNIEQLIDNYVRRILSSCGLLTQHYTWNFDT